MPAAALQQPIPRARFSEARARPANARSTAKGVALVAVHYALYGLTLLGAISPLPLAARFLFGAVNGVFIALLFILGHDAAHGTLVRGRKRNLWLARFCFIPCVHAVSLWRVVHNTRHHARTNLKGVDDVWAPMSKAEYEAAAPARRWLERVCRGPFGPLIYYYGAFWVHRMLLPLAPEVRKDWKRHMRDSLFVLGGFFLTLAGIVVFSRLLAPGEPVWQALAIAWVLPFAVWNYLMGFTIYLNHTHPQILWFEDEKLWRRFRGNVVDTVYVRMPINIAPVYTMVMAHTAHHRDLNTPVYALLREQKNLEEQGAQTISYRLTPGTYRKIYRACKLFDFERLCWIDFDGTPTG